MDKRKIMRVIAAGILGAWLYSAGTPAKPDTVVEPRRSYSYANFAYGSYLLSSITYNPKDFTVAERTDILVTSLTHLTESYFLAEMPDEQKAVRDMFFEVFNKLKKVAVLYSNEIKEARYKEAPGATKMLADIIAKAKTTSYLWKAVRQDDRLQLAEMYLSLAQDMYVGHDIKKPDIKALQKIISKLDYSIGHFFEEFYASEDGPADRKKVVEDRLSYALNEWVRQANLYAFSMGRFGNKDKSISAYQDIIANETSLGIPDQTATNNLAYALLDISSDTGLAMKLVDMSLKTMESLPAIDTKARLLAKDGNYDKALSMIQRAMRLSIDSGNISKAEQLKKGIFNELLHAVRP